MHTSLCLNYYTPSILVLPILRLLLMGERSSKNGVYFYLNSVMINYFEIIKNLIPQPQSWIYKTVLLMYSEKH